MVLSVVVPAFNEEACLATTLEHIRRSASHLQEEHDERAVVELIVVDNNSTDRTASIASAAGARVVSEAARNIAKVRNTGALASTSEVLLFIDADTLVPAPLLSRVNEVMSVPECAGGAVDIRYHPASIVIRSYLAMWRFLGNALGMAQGAAQFCRRNVYLSLGGYDEALFMGEDVDFYWRMKRLAKRTGQTVCPISDLYVVPSSRRFDSWPIWKTLVWTNPLLVLILQRWRKPWSGWYHEPPR